MWYRLILSAREVTDKDGERTIHQTGTQYEKPLFIFDDPNIDTQYNIGGAGSQWFGFTIEKIIFDFARFSIPHILSLIYVVQFSERIIYSFI